MSELKEAITAYHNLSFSDRIVFYTTVSAIIADGNRKHRWENEQTRLLYPFRTEC